jgi:hypothetical protein
MVGLENEPGMSFDRAGAVAGGSGAKRSNGGTEIDRLTGMAKGGLTDSFLIVEICDTSIDPAITEELPDVGVGIELGDTLRAIAFMDVGFASIVERIAAIPALVCAEVCKILFEMVVGIAVDAAEARLVTGWTLVGLATLTGGFAAY